MDKTKLLGIGAIVIFFALVNFIFKSAKIDTAQFSDKSEFEKMLDEPLRLNAQSVKISVPTPVPKKQAAPAWGTFKLAGPAPIAAAKVELQKAITQAVKDSDKKKKELAKKKAEEKKKKQRRLAAMKRKRKVVKADESRPESKVDKWKDDLEATNYGYAPYVPTNATPGSDTNKAKEGKKTAQEWRIYVLENVDEATRTKRVSELISAYKSGQVEGGSASWIYEIAEDLFKDGDVRKQKLAAKILQDLPSTESYIMIVTYANDTSVDSSVRQQLMVAEEVYADPKYLGYLAGALQSDDPKVKASAFSKIENSLNSTLDAEKVSGYAGRGRGRIPRQSSGGVQQFHQLLVSLDMIARTDKDPQTRQRAEELARRIRESSSNVAAFEPSF